MNWTAGNGSAKKAGRRTDALTLQKKSSRPPEPYDQKFIARSFRMTAGLWLGFSVLAFVTGRCAIAWGFLIGGAFNLLDIGSLIAAINLLIGPQPNHQRFHNLKLAGLVALNVLKYPVFFAILYFGLRQQHLSFLNPDALFGFLFLFQAVVLLKIISNMLLSRVGQ